MMKRKRNALQNVNSSSTLSKYYNDKRLKCLWQGSIIMSFLFLIYINDVLGRRRPLCKCSLMIDNCCGRLSTRNFLMKKLIITWKV